VSVTLGDIDQSTARPSAKTDVAYAMIGLGSTSLWAVTSGWLLYFYLSPEGVSRVPASSYALLLLGVNLFQAILNPIVGYMSDHTRGRWGRRLPFMFASSLPMLGLFILLWIPPVQGESLWNLAYLGVVLLLYKATSSLHQIPYRALLPEIALSEHHRVRLSAWYSGLQLAGMILGGFAGLLIQSLGFATASVIYAGVALPLFCLPLLVLRERPARQITAASRLDFWQSMRATLRGRTFQIYTLAWVLYWGTTTLVQAVIPFVATEICRVSKADTIYFYIPAVLGSLVCYPLVMRLSKRVGKWRVFSGSLLASALVLPGLMLIGDWLPIPLLAQGIIWVTLEAIAISGAVMLPSAFAAEITDHDAKLTGQRREGTHYAIWSLLDQVVTGSATALLPLLLLFGRSRTDPRGPLGVRLVGVIGGVLMCAAFVVFLRYPLRHDRVP
jgi:glycoside/pentoside/hexuronide:cation symporter, GPH family